MIRLSSSSSEQLSAPTIEWDMPAARWEEALAGCPEATYFHTSAWLESARELFKTRIERVCFTWPDGHVALLPLSIRPLLKGLMPLACAGETGAFSGLVSPRPLTSAHTESAYRAVRRRYSLLRVVGNPLAASPHLPTTGGQASRESTHLLPLAPLDTLRKGFSRGAKSRGNKARKLGLRLEVANDAQAVSTFYALYIDSVARWGEKLTWQRSEAFFQTVVRDAGEHARIFIAYEGEVATSALVFLAYGRATHYLAGATRADALASCPSNFLMEEALAYYHAAGFEVFDFGASAGLEGVRQFKESFGAKEAPFDSHAYSHWLEGAYTRVRAGAQRLGSRLAASA